MESKTFCALPWSHLHVSVDGAIRMCCVSGHVGSIKENKLEDVWNGKDMKRIRLQMLNNERPVECKKCFDIEDMSAGSFRQSITSEFNQYIDPINDTKPDGTVEEMKLHYVDFRLNNLCNFKCRMCSPNYSSAIGAEVASAHKLKNIRIINDYSDVLYEEMKLQYPHVKKIYFAGGEPVMQSKHFQILRDLIDLDRAKDVTLLYSTNGSRFQTGLGNMFDYWKHFKRVELSISLDGFGKKAEYWRSGTDWEEIESNIRMIKNYPNIHPQIFSTVGWPNVFNWIDFIKYAIDTDLVDSVLVKTDVTILDGPKCYAPYIVPDFKKKAIHMALSQLKEYVMQHMYSTNYDKKCLLLDSIDLLTKSLYIPYDMTPDNKKIITNLFARHITRIDKWRGEDFFTVFPEHEDMREFLT